MVQHMAVLLLHQSMLCPSAAKFPNTKWSCSSCPTSLLGYCHYCCCLWPWRSQHFPTAASKLPKWVSYCRTLSSIVCLYLSTCNLNNRAIGPYLNIAYSSCDLCCWCGVAYVIATTVILQYYHHETWQQSFQWRMTQTYFYLTKQKLKSQSVVLHLRLQNICIRLKYLWEKLKIICSKFKTI